MSRYELLERIGHGGMAEIFRGKAVAAGGFEKPVAIKRILPHLSQDERFVKLLIDEANLLSQLRHRNIVQIFDVGLGPDGQYFIVMEFVDGVDLGALYERLEKKRKRLPMDLALHIGAEVCDALDYAHRAWGSNNEPLELVHRDVSPANIMISASGEVKLTDFGIAKQAEEATGHGGVRGKFAYISPEQAANIHVDARSDVYSLGVVMYELLLGHRLYSGKPDFEALKLVRTGRITPPSEIDPDIPKALEEILMKAVARDPAGRFASAAEMGKAVREFRYSMPASGADPAKELSRVIGRVVKGAGSAGRGGASERVPTVVRIETAAGFSAAGFDQFRPAPRLRELEEVDLDLDDEEVTSARGVRAPGVERAATPTVRDVFFDRGVMPQGTARGVERDRLEPKRRRGGLLYLTIAAGLVAALSFIIASTLMSGGSTRVPGADAGLTIDAAAPASEPAAPATSPAPASKSRTGKSRTGKKKRRKMKRTRKKVD